MLVSVVVPAHNEEHYIGKCLYAVKSAAKYIAPDEVELIVAANRCTDRTAAVARKCGALVVEDDSKCIAAVRNAGVNDASGEVIVTVDADSLMTKYALAEIIELLGSGKYIGGGSGQKFDRMSFGIAACSAYIAARLVPVMLKNGGLLSGGMFWFFKSDFDAIGGFDESLVSLEDMDFAMRLNKLGKGRGLKYGTLRRSYITTSSRKFDQFGDWYLLKNRRLTERIFTGRDREAADQFYYDVR